MTNHDIERIKSLLGTHYDFPQKVNLVLCAYRICQAKELTMTFFFACHQGIVFKDLFPVFQDPTAVEAMISNFVHHINSTYEEKIDVVVGTSWKKKDALK